MNVLEEKIVIKNLVLNDDYFSRVFPFLKSKQFIETYTKKLFDCIKGYNERYNRKPDLAVLKLFVEQVKGVSESSYKDMKETLDYIEQKEDFDLNWLCDSTLDFIRNREYYNAMTDAITKYEKNELDSELPDKLLDALSVTFDTTIGMEFSDAEMRWDAYTVQEDKVPFILMKMNEITKGGVTRKTLNCFMSSNTGGFKSGAMCSLSCDYIRQGYNVLYLTFEMAENKILERIDANLLNTPIDDIVKLGKERYLSKITEIKQKANGRLVVKQFPTSSVHSGHIRALLKELKLKSKFVPDVIMFDYLGIMNSQRYGNSGAAEHQIIKAATEEVRGLCVEYNCVGWTAMQSNRSGSDKGEDLSISDISASYGSAFGFDMILGLITTPEFDEESKIMIKQIKNRYGDANIQNRFFLGLSKPKMKIFDIVDSTDSTYQFTVSKEKQKDDIETERSIFASNYKNPSIKVNTTKFKFE